MPIRRPIRSPTTYSPKDESVSPNPLPARKAYRPEGSALAPRWKLRAGSRAGSLVEACRPWRVATVADNAVRAREPGGFTFAKPRGRYAFTLKERERPTLRSGRALARAGAGGFTLVELIVVIALTSTLMVLVAPAFTASRARVMSPVLLIQSRTRSNRRGPMRWPIKRMSGSAFMRNLPVNHRPIQLHQGLAEL